MGALHGDAVEVPAHTTRQQRQTGHSLHNRLQSLCPMGGRWLALAGVCGQCAASRGRETTRPPCAPWRRDQYGGEKRGDGIGYSGHKHQQGEKVIAIIDNHGYILAPVPVAPVNETDMVLLPESLKALKKVATELGLDLRRAYLNLDGGFASTNSTKCIFNHGLTPAP